MPSYAVFLFDDNKEGMERYEYLHDYNTCTPVLLAKDQFERQFGPSKDIFVNDKEDYPVNINNIRFARQYVAYVLLNGGHAIVLAERIK